MKKKLKCILLVDDNEADNIFHSIIIRGMNITDSIQIVHDGEEAIEFLKKENQVIPELIFLDINMPKINGWEFLEQYSRLDIKQKAKIVIMMLTTSDNPADLEKAKTFEQVSGFKVKPLTEEMLAEILDKHFSDYK